jgi:hypothetical protein
MDATEPPTIVGGSGRASDVRPLEGAPSAVAAQCGETVIALEGGPVPNELVAVTVTV